MAVKYPARLRIKSFGGRFGDVVHDGRPSQPQRVTVFGDVVQDLQGVIEIVLVANAFSPFNSMQGGHFRKELVQQLCFEQQLEAPRWLGREDDLVQLSVNALRRDDLEPTCIASDGFQAAFFNAKPKL